MDYFEAVGALHRLELLRRIKARSLMADSGLHPGQPRLLEYIRSHPGCTQKEAADELDVTPASAAASLKRLDHRHDMVRLVYHVPGMRAGAVISVFALIILVILVFRKNHRIPG